MITKAGLAVLGELSAGRETTPTQLATALEYSRTHLYDVLDTLQRDGLITETRGAHNQRQVRVTAHPVVEAYRHLVSQLSHVEWAELLSPATLRVCWYLDCPRRVSTIADELGITRQGVHNVLTPLKHRAMLSPAGPEYALTADLQPLVEFARAVVTHEHRSRVRTLASSATVEWCDPKRALVRVHVPEDTTALGAADDWQITGLAGFREYGLEFFLAGEPAFWYAPDEEMTPAEMACHTLILESDARRASYTMLLIEKLELKKAILMETAERYDLQTEIDDLYRTIAGERDGTDNPALSLPSDREYAALREQYGIA